MYDLPACRYGLVTSCDRLMEEFENEKRNYLKTITCFTDYIITHVHHVHLAFKGAKRYNYFSTPVHWV